MLLRVLRWMHNLFIRVWREAALSDLQDQTETWGHYIYSSASTLQMKVLFLTVFLMLSDQCLGQYMERLERRRRESCFPESTGTTPFIKEIFIGRCLEHQTETAIPNACPDSPVNCTLLWELFKDAIAYKDPCAIPLDAYDAYIAAIPHQLPADKTIFWSGTSYIVHEFTEVANDLLTLEDTLLGYMVNGLQWCSSTDVNSNGLNYLECPNFWDEGCTVASTAFYSATSSAIARQSQGIITITLDGTRSDGAYRNDSFFALYEFPNLDPQKVTRADIILINRIGTPLVETCNTGSVALLQRMFTVKGIEWTCTENNERVYYIQCAKEPTNPECLHGAETSSGRVIRASLHLTACWTVLLALFAKL